MSGERYTHGHHDSVLRSHRARNVSNSAGYLKPHLVGGLEILDVGCGPGTLTVDLARHNQDGVVHAFDASEDIVEAAIGATPDDLTDAVSFEVGNVYSIDHPDDTFDIAHAHQVLQHLGDPVAALVEMRRVVKPGGLVAVRDGDYASMVWAPREPAMDDWLDTYRRAARANGAEPDAGRYLRTWGRLSGAQEITGSASSWCFADADQCAWWADLWADRVTDSALADQFEELGVGARERAEMAAAWRRWGADADAWFAMVHGELIIEVE